jgi:hypothetical protein
MSRALYALLIPMAWALSPVERGVVVIDAQVLCGTKDPLDEDDVSNSGSNASWVCHKDRMYFFLAAAGSERECFISNGPAPIPNWECISKPFTPPQGMDTMNGEAWSGLVKEDFVIGRVYLPDLLLIPPYYKPSVADKPNNISSLNIFEANGNKKGGTPSNPDIGTETLNDIQDTEIRAPGIMNIPVCTIAEARSNWEDVFYGLKPSANYPCN